MWNRQRASNYNLVLRRELLFVVSINKFNPTEPRSVNKRHLLYSYSRRNLNYQRGASQIGMLGLSKVGGLFLFPVICFGTLGNFWVVHWLGLSELLYRQAIKSLSARLPSASLVFLICVVNEWAYHQLPVVTYLAGLSIVGICFLYILLALNGLNVLSLT
jgi:hypothetical protein